MKNTKKRFEVSYVKLTIYIIVVVFLVWMFFSFIGLSKNCKQDKSCFDKRIVECKKTRYINIDNNNIYDYSVKGKSKDFCVVDIFLRRMAKGTELDIVEKLEGKSMRCKFPADKVKSIGIEDMENMLNYCSGGLKEGILELAVEKLYGLIIENLGGLVGEIRKEVFNI